MSEIYHGRKLTQREYEHAVIELYSSAHSGNMDKYELLKKELNLNIDFRLGVDFPEPRRELLWKVQQEIETKRLSILVKSFLANFVPAIRREHSNSLADFVLNEYAKILSDEELEAYFK